jgi:Fe-S-cluster containining protein
MKNKYPCTMCGCCCRRISVAVDFYTKIEPEYKFPYNWDENGVCEKLENNMCSVYDNRPDMCNIDKFIEEYGLNKEAVYIYNAKSCNKMMEQDGISDEFKIKNYL